MCESESFTENFTVVAGQRVTKTWTFRNAGLEPIAKGTRLVTVDGRDLGYSVPAVQTDVAVGACFGLSVDFAAPRECDHYSSGFMLQSQDNRLFGEKVWCDIIIEDDMSDAMRVSQLMEIDDFDRQKHF